MIYVSRCSANFGILLWLHWIIQVKPDQPSLLVVTVETSHPLSIYNHMLLQVKHSVIMVKISTDYKITDHRLAFLRITIFSSSYVTIKLIRRKLKEACNCKPILLRKVY